MRILHLSKYYHPYRGGIEKVIKELSMKAVSLGHEVTVVCSNEWNYRSEEMVEGVRVIRLPKLFSLFSQPITPSVFWEVQRLFRAADVVHLHTPNPLFELACLRFEIPCPFVVTYHCEVMKARLLNAVYRPISRAILKRADRILVATPFHIEFSRALKDYESKCEVIPFGIEPKFSSRSLETNFRLNSIKEKYGRYFLFVGRMVTYKGVNILLEAMKQVDQNLLLIGKGPRMDEWRQMSLDMGLRDRVHFLGAVESDTDFSAYIHGSDGLVLPSINEAEAFGLVLLEAMSCRKPAITTDLKSGVRYVNLAEKTGLVVPPSDSEALAQAMNLLRTDDEKRHAYGEAAFRHFQENFLVTQSLHHHLSVYESLRQKPVAA